MTEICISTTNTVLHCTPITFRILPLQTYEQHYTNLRPSSITTAPTEPQTANFRFPSQVLASLPHATSAQNREADAHTLPPARRHRTRRPALPKHRAAGPEPGDFVFAIVPRGVDKEGQVEISVGIVRLGDGVPRIVRQQRGAVSAHLQHASGAGRKFPPDSLLGAAHFSPLLRVDRWLRAAAAGPGGGMGVRELCGGRWRCSGRGRGGRGRRTRGILSQEFIHLLSTRRASHINVSSRHDNTSTIRRELCGSRASVFLLSGEDRGSPI